MKIEVEIKDELVELYKNMYPDTNIEEMLKEALDLISPLALAMLQMKKAGIPLDPQALEEFFKQRIEKILEKTKKDDEENEL